MSQKKISKRKQEELMKQKKRQKLTAIVLIVAVIAACAGGIGWGAYDRTQKNQAEQEAKEQKQKEIEMSKQATDGSTVNVDSILEYLSGLDTELLNNEISPDQEKGTP